MPKLKGKLIPVISLILTALLLVAVLWASNDLKCKQQELAYLESITPAPTLAPPTLFARPTEMLLRSGSIGPEVEHLQQRLQALGYYIGEIDGRFGGGTRTAVEIFQAQHNLKSDGMAGAETMAALFADTAQTMAPQLSLSPMP